MPELPEVESIARRLERALRGQPVRAVELRLARILPENGPVELQSPIGKHISGRRRWVQYLLLFVGDLTLAFHLGMTGQLTLLSPGKSGSAAFRKTVTGLQVAVGEAAIDAYTRLVITLRSGLRLLFR